MSKNIVLFIFIVTSFFLQISNVYADAESDLYYEKKVVGKQFMESVRDFEEEEIRKAEMRLYDKIYGAEESQTLFFLAIIGIIGVAVIIFQLTTEKIKQQEACEASALRIDKEIMKRDDFEILLSNAAYKGFVIDKATKRCPYCAEEIYVASKRCAHCKKDFTKSSVEESIKASIGKFINSKKRAAL